MDPALGYVGNAVDVTIHGKNFFVRVTRDLGSGEEFAIDDGFLSGIRLQDEAGEFALENVSYGGAHILTATVPAGIPAGVYELSVTSPYDLTGRLPEAYTATGKRPPEITGVAPADVVNDSDTPVGIQGTNFEAGLELVVGDTPLGVQSVGASEIRFVIPAGFPSGSWAVAVVNPDGQKASREDAITVHEPAVLAASLDASPLTARLGEVITLSLSVSNPGATAALGLSPGNPFVSGDGSVERLSGPEPASADLGPDRQQAFVWTYRALAVGEMSFEAGASGVNEYSGRSVGTGNVRSDPVRITQCAVDLDCSNPTPICDAGGECRGCTNDPECEARDVGAPLCDVGSGACVECLSAADCPYETPVCDAAGVCRGCTSDAQCDDGDPCTTNESCAARVCVAGPADKDTDDDGYVDAACGGNDCNDSDPGIHPGAADSDCDNVDENCSGSADEDYLPTVTACGTGVCASTGQLECQSGTEVDTCAPGSPTETPEITCDDNLDNDCDGLTDANDPACSGSPINIILPANGGVLESFTSEFCDPQNLPGNCQAGYWEHTNIHDGDYAVGYNPTAFRASWASADKNGSPDPEEFVFSFDNGRSAWVETVVVQNYGEEGGAGPYYATHFVLYGEPHGGGAWFVVLDEDLPQNETQQTFDLTAINGSMAHVGRLRLSITDSVHSDYWELGEIEAWGYLE